MEREGSGFDRIYQALLSTGRPAPEVREGDDRVVVTIYKRIANPEIVDFMFKVDQTFQPSQKELITLGLIAQHEALKVNELVKLLDLKDATELQPWLGRLREWNLVEAKGKTKATEYLVHPAVLRKMEFKGQTTLKGIEKHRLRELILRDLEIYHEATRPQIHQRIGIEIAEWKLRRVLSQLVTDGDIIAVGGRKERRYLLSQSSINNP